MNTKNYLLSYLIATGTSLAITSSYVSAQETEAQERDGTKTVLLEEVVVVASTRTGTDLSKTAAAVTALSAKSLSRSGITDPTSLQEQSPNISIDRQNGLQITIRGVSSTDNTEKGDPSASFLQNGVYIARAQSQEVSFFDLEQVEILRGPQGTLYGRNATAGLINVLTAKPDMDEMYGSFDGTLGDYSKRQATAMYNLPISDSAAIRAAVNIDQRDSYLNKAPDSAVDITPAKDNLSFRLSGLFDLNEDTTLFLVADHSQLEGSNRSNVKLSNFYDISTVVPSSTGGRGVNPTYIGGSQSSDELRTAGFSESEQGDFDNSTQGVLAELNWELSDDITVTYLGSYREFERNESYTGFSGTVANGAVNITGPRLFTGDYSQDSHELRFTYTTDRMNLQSGIYSFSEDVDIEFLLIGSGGTSPGDDNYVFGFPQGPVTSDSLAFFAQGTFDLSDTLRLTAGVRKTDDDKSRRGATIHHRDFGEAQDFTFDAVTNPRPDSLNLAQVDYSKTTWKLGLDYDLNDDILIYGIVSTGYKAGGFNDGCLATDDNCNDPIPEAALFYDPETLTAYEAGVKMDFDNGLRTFISLFNYDYKNLQLSNVSNLCGGPCTVTSNAGEADITGLELETRYYFNDRNKVNFAATWLKAEYADYQLNDSVNLAGDPLNRSPEFTINLGYEHVMPLDNGGNLVFAGNYRWSDDYYILSPQLASQFEQPSFSKTDVSVTYEAPDDRWYVQGYVKNLEDEVTISNAAVVPAHPNLGDGNLNVSDPRTAGVRFGLNF